MGESVDLALYAQVVNEGITVKVAELRGIPLQNGALKRYDNVGFHKNSFLEGDQALETLDKQHHVSIVNVLANRHYFALAIHSIEM